MTDSTKDNRNGQSHAEEHVPETLDTEPGQPEGAGREEASGAAPAAASGKTPEEQIADLKDRLLRAVAETENIRRRAEREREDTAKYAVTGFAKDLLNVADNLRRALQNLSDDVRAKDEAVAKLADGVELTERELLRVFEKHGIRVVEPQPGEKFDHNFHQAMFEVPNTDQPPGAIVTVMQAGYALKDRLLRPAMVGVAKAPPGSEPEQKVDTKV
jgi:molecular chaperone GrpE